MRATINANYVTTNLYIINRPLRIVIIIMIFADINIVITNIAIIDQLPIFNIAV